MVGRAILLVLLANLFFSFVDTSTKWLIGAGLAVLQLAFIRYFVHFLITLGEAALRGQRVPSLDRPIWGLVALRAFCLVSSTIANFIALGQLPLAITSAILFLSPVLVCIFARLLLNEGLTTLRIFAILLGFSGVLIIVNPFGEAVNWYAVLMLYPASGMALYIVLTRKLAGRVSPLVLQFNTGLLGTLALLPLAFISWQTPVEGGQWVLLLSIGAFAWFGHEVLTRAHGLAEASLLAPFGYSFVIYLTFFGWLVFDEVPTAGTLIGAAGIIFAGLAMSRER